MGRTNNPKHNYRPQQKSDVPLAVVPVLVLIGIGNAVRNGLRACFAVLVKAYNIVRVLAKELPIAGTSWLKEKSQLLKKKKLVQRKPRRKLITQRVLWRLSKKVTASLRKLKVPKIALPRVSLPILHLPKITIPEVSLPKISLPRLTIPKQKVIYPPRGLTRDQVKSFVVGVAVTVLFVFVPYTSIQWVKSLPNPQLLAHRDLEVTTKIFDRTGALLYEIYADQNRTPVPLSEIPDVVKQATIAIEDKDFYRHQGISLRGIVRALREIVLRDRIQGGSTITQQLIKSALLTPEVKLSRKIREIILAFWAERIYSKNQILEMYLNQVPYGGTAWGIGSASRMYFGKSVRDLTLAEAAILAGLPTAPTEYSPFGSHPEKAFDRQAEVLRRMVEERYITKKEAQDALAQEIHFEPPRVAIRAPHFVMYVKTLLERRYGPRLVDRGGLRVVTSLDIGIQEKIEDIVRSHVEALRALRVGNGAALVTNPKTGEILGMVGSRDYFNVIDEGNVNVTTSLRQPGSSIKVVNYVAALENGFTAATVIDDSPIVYKVPGSPPYSPVNYDGKFHGPTPLRYALGNSYNIPAVKVLSKIGVGTMIEKGRLMGITSWKDESRYGLSLTLGGGDVTMLETATIYGSLANAGRRVDLLPVLEVTDYAGRVIERNRPKRGVQAIKPEVAWILSNILSDNSARSAAFGPSSTLVIPGKTVSVKTGTSNDKRDNWTIGYTPSLVAAVWVGNNNNAPMDPYLTSGITGASPIWHDIIVELLKDKPDEVPEKPDGVVAIPCYFGRVEYFMKGTEPPGGRCAPLPTPSPTPTPTPNP